MSLRSAVMYAILTLIDTVVDLYIYTLLAYVICSWLIAFKIINPWQPFVRQILTLFPYTTLFRSRKSVV